MARMRLSAVLAVLLGCIPQIPTAAVVTRVRHEKSTTDLIACQVTLGWTEDELRGNCGQPDAMIGWAGHGGGSCHIYRTSAKSFATGVGVEAIAACLGPAAARDNSVAPHRHVDAVFGLAADAMQQLGATR